MKKGKAKLMACLDFLDIEFYSFCYIARLYEQGADINRIRDYVKKRLQWVHGFGADMSLFGNCRYQRGLLFSVQPHLK